MYANWGGRWLTPDPGGRSVAKLDYPETWNLYAYVKDNPFILTDPSGLVCIAGITITNIGGHCAGDDPPPPPPPPRLNPDGTPQQAPTPANRSQLNYKAGVPEAQGDLGKLVGCIQQCAAESVTVTSTNEPPAGKLKSTRAHGPGTPHGKGEAADLRVRAGVTAAREKVLGCAAQCGAGFGLDEYAHPSAHATGGHIHVQTTPGRNGGRGDLPEPPDSEEE
jgi:hypothetical protein